jgi:5,5'-dehydrodivanillate O-demethylase
MGNLLRRYWHPVATLPDLERERVMGVRILGEDLVLYKSRRDEIGLIAERCAHRSVSLAYGIPSDDGLRCEYHGWVYGADGRCLEQPFEEMEHQNANFKDKISIPAYPVQTMGGLVFAYMGPPEKMPLLPKWETFAREGVNRTIMLTTLPCNWLQCMENSLDPVHFEWLHANQTNWQLEKRGEAPNSFPARHQKIDFDLFDYGIYKRRLLVGQEPSTSPDWNIGHPILFPNILALSGRVGHSFQIRVPIDDANTWHVNMGMFEVSEGEEPAVTVKDLPWKRDGKYILDEVLPQDFIAWETQAKFGKNGTAPRHLEHLGVSDRGIILYRQALSDAIDAVARGDDPPGVVFTEAQNEALHIRGEDEGGGSLQAYRIPGVVRPSIFA